MEIKEESVYTKNRLIELSRRSYEQGICLFSNFLDASGIKAFEEIKKELYPCGYYLNGGFPDAERLMVCFGTGGRRVERLSNAASGHGRKNEGGNDENVLAIIDTSGSMYCNGKTIPAAVALSLMTGTPNDNHLFISETAAGKIILLYN